MTTDRNINLVNAERTALRSLDRLVKIWPEHLMLCSFGGSLVVIHADDLDAYMDDSEHRDELELWSSIAIPNDGGAGV